MATNITQEREVINRAREEIEKRTGKTPEELYAEREKRVTDAIQLKKPDRVPVWIHGGYFPIKYAGLSPSALYSDPAACQAAVIKTLLDFDSDLYQNTAASTSGLALEKLGSKQWLWPGASLRPDQNAQWLEMEIMKENEYDLFIADPGDFILRYYLPRAYQAMAPLSKLPPLQSLVGQRSLATQSILFSSPEIIQAFEALFKAGQEQAKFSQWHQAIGGDLGFPPLTYPGGVATPPFDVIVTYLRGMPGTMVDMFKRPEKLLAAMERVLEWRLATAVPAEPKERGTRRVGGGANHFQSEEFLSRKQFDTFVWPTYKKALMATIDLGFVPSPFMEGKNDDRIECFLELPKGKAFLHFEKIDMARAKAILGDHFCIAGGVPLALLWGGSPQEVEEYCKNIIKVCGKGGGFILGPYGGLDDAKPANVKAMIDSAKKYGRY